MSNIIFEQRKKMAFYASDGLIPYWLIITVFSFMMLGCNGTDDIIPTGELPAPKALEITQISLNTTNSEGISQQAFTTEETITATATVLDENDDIVEGVTVSFSSTIGQLSNESLMTDVNGQVTVTITNPTSEVDSGSISATIDVLSADAFIEFVAMEQLSMSISIGNSDEEEQVVFARGKAITVTATVVDQDNNAVQGETVNFSSTLGNLSAVSGTSNEDGKAIVTIENPLSIIGTGIASVTLDSLVSTAKIEYVDEPLCAANPTAFKSENVLAIQSEGALEALKNPYRGFRYETIFLVQADGSVVNAWNRDEVIDVQSKIDELKVNYGSTDEHIRLSQLYIYLTDFVGGDISPAALTTIQGIFDNYKTNNLQALLRWVYDYDGDAASGNSGVSGVTFADITNHLTQLTPIVRGTDGVISHMNGGVLGLWGEWHNRSASLLSDQAGLDNMFTEILDAHLPSYMPTQVRIPTYKTNRTLSQDLLDRIGFHNDFFTVGDHARAPGNDYVPGTAVYQTVKEQSPYAVVDGEMPYDGATEWHMGFAVDVYKALKIFNEHHYNSFSVVHSYGINISQWKNVVLDKAKLANEAGGIRYHADYFMDNGVDVDRSMYDFVRDHLGYRLYLNTTSSSVLKTGQAIDYSFEIENYGFSRPYTNNDVKVVILDSENNIVAMADNDVDMSTWQPVDPEGNQSKTLKHTLSGQIELSTDLATFKLGLYMPSKSLGFEDNNEYAVKLANRTDVKTVSAVTGEEIYVFHDSTIRDSAPYCGVSSNCTAQDRYIENIQTTNALANIQTASAILPVDSYRKYNDEVLKVSVGSTFNLSLTNSTNTKWSRAFAWLDWNNDGDFDDDGEEVFALGLPGQDNSDTVLSIAESISVPNTAMSGSSRMRIRFHDAWSGSENACGDNDNSTTFDIGVEIIPEPTAVEYCSANNVVHGNEAETRKEYFITNFTTTGGSENISYSNGTYPTLLGDGHGEDYSSFVEVAAGQAFTLDINPNIPGSGELHAAMTIWIDYNGDGDFDDANEIILQLGSPSQNNRAVLENISEVITVPAGTTAGDKRMRIRMRDAWVPPATACGDNSIASALDFLIKVI